MRQDDAATQIEELQREAALRVRKPVLPACGSCYNCGEDLPENKCYCDADCRDDHEKRQRVKHA